MATLESIELGEQSVAAHSMPVYSEIEGETQKSSRKRSTIIVTIVLLLLVSAIIGLSVGLSNNKKQKAANAATSAESSQSGNFGGNDGNVIPNPDLTNEESEEEPSVPSEEEQVPAEGDTPAEEAVVEESAPTISTAPTPTAIHPESLPLPFSESDASVFEEPQNGTRIGYIIDFLVDNGVASRTDLETEGSYAYKAVDWISNVDHMVLPVPLGAINGTNETLPLEAEETFITRYTLAHIYYALGGPKWTNQANFLSEKPSCEWMEIVQSLPVGVGCTQDGRVRSLFLNNNMLQNDLPSELGLLTDLIMLDLDLNFIQGTLPESFQSLTALEHLHMGSAGLTGTIPSWIGTFSSLGSLNLGYNVMHGTIPSEILSLPVLRELALDHNAFEGDVNALFSSGSLTSLEELYLDSNSFIGSIGEDFAHNMVNLKQLDLSDNAFTGALPRHFFYLPKLQVLDVHDNEFASLPKGIYNNTVLKFFSAQKNLLAGNMETIINLSALTHLDLSQNQLTGTMPESLGERVVGLTYLFLAENNFDAGTIPFSLSNLFSLKELSLKSTSRTGSIPNILGMMNELVFLDLDNNSLEGDIPSTMGSLTNLHLLLLNRNNLVNQIPSEFGKLSHLQTFFLEGNNITGGLDYTCNSADAEAEIIAQCSLCDTVPGCCTQCCEEGEACNTKTHVADVDPIWQLAYKRDDYALDKEDAWR